MRLHCFVLFFPFKASQIILICSKACEPLIWGLESADHVMVFSKTEICEFWQGLMWRNIRDIWPRLHHGAGYILCKPVHLRVSFRGIATDTLNRGAFQMGFNTSRNQNVCIKVCFHHCAEKKRFKYHRKWKRSYFWYGVECENLIPKNKKRVICFVVSQEANIYFSTLPEVEMILKQLPRGI